MKIKQLFFILTLLAIPQISKSAESKESTLILKDTNLIVLNKEVDSASVAEVMTAANALDKKMSKKWFNKKTPIYLFLSTPGGSIQAGLELIEGLKGLGRPVHTITLFAASMGFQIVQSMGERYILKNGVLMSHKARGQFSGEFGGAGPSQMDSRYALWLERVRELDEQTVRRTKGKQTMASYTKQYENEMWPTGTQSVSRGYADKTVMIKCDPSLFGKDTHEFILMGIMKILYDTDKCPIITGITNVRVAFETTKGYMTTEEFLKNGGSFGPSCTSRKDNHVCAADSFLTLSKLEELKDQFIKNSEINKNKALPMTW